MKRLNLSHQSRPAYRSKRWRSCAFTPSNLRRKARLAWGQENERRAGNGLDSLVPIGFHELRHSAVTFFSEAGLTLEEIGDLVGHSSTYMSDRYRHLRVDHRDALLKKLNSYALLASTSTRLEQIEAAVTA